MAEPGGHVTDLHAGLLRFAWLLLRTLLLPAILFFVGVDLVGEGQAPALWIALVATLGVTMMPASVMRARGRALLLVVFLGVVALLMLAHFGPLIGISTLFVAATVFASIFFRTRGLMLCLLGLVGGVSGVLLLMHGGYVDAPALEYRVVTDPMNWVQTGISFFVGFVAVGASLTYMVVGHQKALRETALALLRARQERERAQAARELLGEARRLEAVARLAGGVAHDFNNALVVILGAAEMLRRRADEGSSDGELAQDLLDAARRAAEITRQLMTLGRRDISRASAVSVEGALGSLQRSLARVLPADIELKVEGGADVHVWMDPTQFEQVLMNLSVNARDAMPKGGLLSIRASVEGGEGDLPERVRIEVADEGEGIERASLERIFEPFFTTKSRGRGTGLGLATVREILQSAGGDVKCASTLGRGSQFTIHLPATARQGEGSVDPDTTTTENMRRTSRRILLVEDRDDVRELTAEALRAAGNSVVEAHDGRSAEEAIREAGPFELLCTDGVMPDTNTNDLIGRFQREFPGVPVLVCSGHVTEDLLRRGIETGRYAYLPKPYTPAQLLQVIEGLSP